MSLPAKNLDFACLSQGSLPTPDTMMMALLEQQKLLEEKDESLKNLQVLIDVLQEKLRLMNLRMFGTSSEKNLSQEDWLVDEAELLAGCEPDPDDGEMEPEEAADEKPPRKRRPRKGLDPKLTRVQEYVCLSARQPGSCRRCGLWLAV